jgi:hypothetical protein
VRRSFFEPPLKSAAVKFENRALITVPPVRFDQETCVERFSDINPGCGPIIPKVRAGTTGGD